MTDGVPPHLRQSVEAIVAYWREHGEPDPAWPADLPFALASELLILLDAIEAKP